MIVGCAEKSELFVAAGRGSLQGLTGGSSWQVGWAALKCEEEGNPNSVGGLPMLGLAVRLAPEETSIKLTGYEHNAVTCIGMQTDIPVSALFANLYILALHDI
ncbi:hypothetical protein F3Y22_tig00005411pilonHSYRG00018 [Hibiscus syriacus]|uniref:Uncharacterized protein n=1 Tax=Hibiscus syriacus TaxID=106335 RepID=A0A6A3CKK6_HIBSY|nr:hypothetical protein F3Y22_tig00005411pilonHSYRG00018 [Hibiscus syriacus]